MDNNLVQIKIFHISELDGYEQTIAYIRRVCEEAILTHKEARIEIYVLKKDTYVQAAEASCEEYPEVIPKRRRAS